MTESMKLLDCCYSNDFLHLVQMTMVSRDLCIIFIVTGGLKRHSLIHLDDDGYTEKMLRVHL